jgi:hypothetical protein
VVRVCVVRYCTIGCATRWTNGNKCRMARFMVLYIMQWGVYKLRSTNLVNWFYFILCTMGLTVHLQTVVIWLESVWFAAQLRGSWLCWWLFSVPWDWHGMCSQFDNRILYNNGFCRSDGTSLMALGVQYYTTTKVLHTTIDFGSWDAAGWKVVVHCVAHVWSTRCRWLFNGCIVCTMAVEDLIQLVVCWSCTCTSGLAA